MNDTMSRLRSEVLALPVNDRAELASWLLANLDDEEEDDPATVEAAWAEELDKRMAEITSGTAQGIPLEKFLEEMRRKYP